MILAVSLVVAVVFGSGAFLLLQRDLLRVVVGIILISNSAVLFVIAAGLGQREEAPILPLPVEPSAASDPLVQAMALTALVISSSVAALLLSLVYRLYVAEKTVDLADLSEAETRDAEALEKGEEPKEEGEPREDPETEEAEERTR